MRTTARFILIAAITAGILGGASLAGHAMPFQWDTDHDGVLAKAKEENKPVIMYFFYPANLKRDREVLQHPHITRYGDDFLGVMINIELFSEIASQYNLNVFPAVLFFDPKGNELITKRYEDTQLNRKDLAQRMKNVLESIDEFALLDANFEQFKDSPNYRFRYAVGLLDRAEFDRAEDLFMSVIEDDQASSNLVRRARNAHQKLMILRATWDFYAERFDSSIDTLQRFLSLYDDDEEAKNHIEFLLGIAYYEAGDQQNGLKLLKRLAGDRSAGIFREKARRYLDRNQ